MHRRAPRRQCQRPRVRCYRRGQRALPLLYMAPAIGCPDYGRAGSPLLMLLPLQPHTDTPSRRCAPARAIGVMASAWVHADAASGCCHQSFFGDVLLARSERKADRRCTTSGRYSLLCSTFRSDLLLRAEWKRTRRERAEMNGLGKNIHVLRRTFSPNSE